MTRVVEILKIAWLCGNCHIISIVALHKRNDEAFPSREDFSKHKPYSCLHCGAHKDFEVQSFTVVERKSEY